MLLSYKLIITLRLFENIFKLLFLSISCYPGYFKFIYYIFRYFQYSVFRFSVLVIIIILSTLILQGGCIVCSLSMNAAKFRKMFMRPCYSVFLMTNNGLINSPTKKILTNNQS